MIYEGCNFRTNLEARWAIFFDEMNLDWAYLEPKNHDYTPDFFLPQKKSFIEISEQIPSQQELNIYDDFAEKALEKDMTFRLIIGDMPRATSDFGAFKQIKQQLKKPVSLSELSKIGDKIKGVQAFKLLPENAEVMFFGQWDQKPQLGTKLFKTTWVMADRSKVDMALIKARKVRF